MKRTLSLLLLFFLCLLPSARTLLSHAEENAIQSVRYAVADSNTVDFYADPNGENMLFTIPYTYYVKVTREGDLMCAVEYLENRAPYRKVSGWCYTNDLTFVDFIPQRPYLYREITLSYYLPQTPTIGNGSFATVDRTFVYYGARYTQDGLFFYVGREGVFDYIPAQEELIYELNTDYLPPVSGGEVEKEETAGLSPAQITFIVLGCAACALLAGFILRGKKPSLRSNCRER